MEPDTVEYPCVMCRQQVEGTETAMECDLCERWEHMACIRQSDKLSEALYTALVGCYSKAIMYVCFGCHRKGSVAKRLLHHEVECAHANEEQLASAHLLTKCDSTINELYVEKQQLTQQCTDVEQELAKLHEELAKVTMRLAGTRQHRSQATHVVRTPDPLIPILLDLEPFVTKWTSLVESLVKMTLRSG